MHIAGGADRLVEFLSQLHNLPVQILQISDRADLRHLRITDHKFIVAGGLNLQVIIKFDNSRDFFFRTFIYNSPESSPASQADPIISPSRYFARTLFGIRGRLA